MSFLTKYRELGFSDESLVAWYEFNDEFDSSPNENHITFPLGISSSSMFSGGRANFDDSFIGFTKNDWPGWDEELEVEIYNNYNVAFRPTFTAFFDFEKKNHSQPDIIFSNNYYSSVISTDQLGFFFGCNQNGDFFLHVNSSQGSIIKIFDQIRTANRSLLAFSRNNYEFTLSSYSPISGKVESQTVFCPPEFTFMDWPISLGSNSLFAPQNFLGSNFTLYEFAIIDGGVPNFVISSLCQEIYESSGSPRSSYLFKFVSLADKRIPHRLELISGNAGTDTGITLPFSSISSGFSLLGQELEPSARFFKNGLVSAPTIFSNYVQFVGQKSTDLVTVDNFPSPVIFGIYSSGFSGHSTGLFPRGKAAVYSYPYANRLNDGFVTLDSGILCYHKKIIFEGNPNLVKI